MKKKLAFICAGLIFILFFSVCKDFSKQENQVSYRNHSDSVTYVGIHACRDCHADKFETFIETGMGKSFHPARDSFSSARFDNAKAVYDQYLDLYYFPFLKNGAIFIREFRLQGKDTSYQRVEKVSYIIGSGHHTNSHLLSENGYVYQAPLTFYTQKGQWDLPPGFEQGQNSRFSRKIGLECMSCHNALPTTDANADNRYLELPHGIDCERCHGPGSLHISEMKKGNGVDISKAIDYTIVNPGKLPWELQIDVCQRCHLQGNAVLKPGKEFTDFRPGMKLSTVFNQFSPAYQGGDNFVMAAHAERFQQSLCFIKTVNGDLSSASAKPAFTCISCHNPHVSVKNTKITHFNNTCKSCHSATHSKTCSASSEKRSSLQDNCVQCHMPASGTSDIPHVTVHDHFIRKPQNKSVSNGRLIGLRCITDTNIDAATETEAYISYYEKFEQNKLFLQKAEEKSKELDKKNSYHAEILIHLYYTNGHFKEITELVSKVSHAFDAWTYYRIGKAYENLNKAKEAEIYLLKAHEMKPGHLDFLLQYIQLLIKSTDWKKSEKYLNLYIQKYSKSADAWAYMGLVKMQNQQFAESKSCFIKALNLDPDQLLALQNLLTLYDLQGETALKVKTQSQINQILKRRSVWTP